MSCLPSFLFVPNLPTILRLYDSSSDPNTDEERQITPAMDSSSTDVVDDLYDKLTRVSVSHRRIDSFEWVMTQSAPNTPPTSLDFKNELCSPPSVRRVGSAPLPAPSESWSSSLQACEGSRKRGYFDWLSSPILGFNSGYTKLSSTQYVNSPDSNSHSVSRKSIAGPSRALRPQAEQCIPDSPYSDSDETRLSHDYNALGIVLSTDPPSNPPLSNSISGDGSPCCHPATTPHLSKRVSFSPVVDESTSEAFPEFDTTAQPSSLWGSYLPSSFLVARPPLTRTTSSPVPRRTVATRPILKRSTSSCRHVVHQSGPSTEMMCLSPNSDAEDTAIVASPIPTQRISDTKSPIEGQRQVENDQYDTDKAFVAILQAKSQHTRRRCDSLLSNTSLPIVHGF